MIAPIQSPEASAPSPGIRRARHLVASTLLRPRSRPPDSGPSVPAWRAWLFTIWVVVISAAYFAYMAGLL
ncbi:MAG: hypothetical protein ACYSWU_17150 [Planctomycetota bacterium]|jgi:hypothetical protein